MKEGCPLNPNAKPTMYSFASDLFVRHSNWLESGHLRELWHTPSHLATTLRMAARVRLGNGLNYYQVPSQHCNIVGRNFLTSLAKHFFVAEDSFLQIWVSSMALLLRNFAHLCSNFKWRGTEQPYASTDRAAIKDSRCNIFILAIISTMLEFNVLF